MELFLTIFHEVLYRPLFNALIFLYNNLPFQDLGLAIIVLTLVIRFIFYPLSQKAIRSQQDMKRIQPKIKELQKKYKNKEEQAKAMMDLYKEHKVNPMAGCLPILVQLPILIALYRVFLGVNGERMSALYSFVENPENLNFLFLGLLDLSERSIILAILVGISQFFQSKMIMPKIKSSGKKGGSLDFSNMMSQQMTYFMPFLSVFIALTLPAALPLYWLVNTLFQIGQQYLSSRTEMKSGSK